LIQREFDFLNAVGEQGAISLHRALRYDEERLAALRRLVAGLVLALEAKDPSSYGHSLRVAHCARRTGEAMGMSGRDVERLYHAGLLHDIGAIGGAGTDPAHPVVGARMLAPLGVLDEVVPMVRHHREHFDGTGVPDGLTGAAIPVGARILGVCNALENLLSGRSGGARLPLRDALDSVRSGAGTRFDPEVVWACAALLEADPSAIKPAETPESYWARLRDDLAGAVDGPFRWTSRFSPSS
jgi:putative nucleotidyltransferase with HDIG domain